MRIIQVLPGLLYGDAIGNFALQIKDWLKSNGYKTEIYADHIGENVPKGVAKKCKKNAIFRNDDIILYHMSTGSPLNREIARLDRRKIMIFHNITPPDLYWKYNKGHAERLQSAYRDLEYMAGKFDAVIAMSNFNQEVLLEHGYSASNIYVSHYHVTGMMEPSNADQSILNKYADSKTNILFVGRVVPHKKHEDIIAAFAWYKKHLDPTVRLFLVGAHGQKQYVEALLQYIKQLNAEDVFLTGKVSNAELESYYCLADIFLCMSEYEGFCVPLVEAMQHKIPVISYAAGAIPDTLGKSGILLKEKSPVLCAKAIEQCLKDLQLRNQIIDAQTKQLEKYSFDKVTAVYSKVIEKYTNIV